MKKIIGIIIVLIIAIIVIALIANWGGKTNTGNETSNLTSVENKETGEIEEAQKTEEEGYEIIIPIKNYTIEKGLNTTFDVTFTNPDESSIREYIKCEDQNDIILIKYSDIKDKKITVDVEALKAGYTEIEVSDYNYPNKKEIVKVTVVETN